MIAAEMAAATAAVSCADLEIAVLTLAGAFAANAAAAAATVPAVVSTALCALTATDPAVTAVEDARRRPAVRVARPAARSDSWTDGMRRQKAMAVATTTEVDITRSRFAGRGPTEFETAATGSAGTTALLWAGAFLATMMSRLTAGLFSDSCGLVSAVFVVAEPPSWSASKTAAGMRRSG